MVECDSALCSNMFLKNSKGEGEEMTCSDLCKTINVFARSVNGKSESEVLQDFTNYITSAR
jgi:hypothetical protein